MQQFSDGVVIACISLVQGHTSSNVGAEMKNQGLHALTTAHHCTSFLIPWAFSPGSQSLTLSSLGGLQC